MTKRLNLLTPFQIKNAKPGARLNDGGGLSFDAGSGGGKWTFRFTAPAGERAGKQRELGLGTSPAVGLAEARRKATEARAAVERGLDPIAERDTRERAAREQAEATARAWTLGRYADERFVPFATKPLRNAASVQAWRTTFATYLAPLRHKRLAEITRADVLEVMEPMWAEKEETAARVLQRLERLFSHAIQNGHCAGANPADRKLFDQTLKRTGIKKRGPHKSVPHDNAPKLLPAIRAKQGTAPGAVLLEFIMLSGGRTSEARLATWGELDLGGRIWTIPAQRMKKGRAHVVPLSARMMALLELARQGRPADLPPPKAADLVFLNPVTGGAFSINAARQLLQHTTGGKETVHGFRATFKTWAHAATEFPRELIEEALAHQLDAVEASYQRASAVERRRKLMEAWEAHLEGRAAPAGNNVVELRPAAVVAGGQA